jgi:ribosomal protein S4E
MTEPVKFYTKKFWYNDKTREACLTINYNFGKLNKERRKDIKKRLKDLNEIVELIEKNEGMRMLFKRNRKVVLVKTDKKEGAEKEIEIYKPIFWNLKLKIRTACESESEKNEIFNPEILEKYLIFGTKT